MMHPMRRTKQEITDQQIQAEILNNAVACRIAFFDGTEPYIVPLSYGWESKDGIITIFIHSAGAGRKLPLFKEGKTVCFEVEDNLKIEPAESACNWGIAYRSLIGWGVPQEITDSSEKSRALNIITGKYGGPSNSVFPENALEKTAVFSLILSKVTGKRSN